MRHIKSSYCFFVVVGWLVCLFFFLGGGGGDTPKKDRAKLHKTMARAKMEI